MRIALLIYGRLNKAITQFTNIENNIFQNNLNSQIDCFCSSDNSKHMENFINLYSPKNFINDEIIVTDNLLNYYKFNFNTPSETNIKNVIKHFTNKKRVFELMEKYSITNKIKYDVVISYRIDIQLISKFDICNPKYNTIYIPEGQDWRMGINDQIAYGSQNVMKKYCNILNNIHIILKYKLSKYGFHPENLTLANIKYNNIYIYRFKLSYIIVR